jgi:hypothetical protein
MKLNDSKSQNEIVSELEKFFDQKPPRQIYSVSELENTELINNTLNNQSKIKSVYSENNLGYYTIEVNCFINL